MKRTNYIYALLIAIVVVVIIGYLIANRNTNSSNTSATNPTSSTTGSTNSGSSSNTPKSSSGSNSSSSKPVATNAVKIKGMAFSPANITVKTGAKVTWTNDDSVAHTVVENDSQTGPKSGDIMPGKSYSFTFTKAGTYHYHCTIHPNMIGTVTVTK